MIKKTFTFMDFYGVHRSEDHYFHLSEADLLQMQFGVQGGLAEYIQKIINALDGPSIMAVIEDLIKKSYGVKSPDGRGFIKNDAVYEAFRQTEAYSMLFVELVTKSDAAAEFVKGLIPSSLSTKLEGKLPDNLA